MTLPHPLTQSDLPPSPFLKANIFSKLFFWWLNGLFGLGSKRALLLTDLYQTLPNDRSSTLGDKMSREWESQVASGSPSLRKAILRLFGPYYFLVGLLALVEECFTRIAQPLCLGYLIRYFSDSSPYTERDGYLFAGGVVLGSAFYTFTHHPYFFGVQHVGMKIRIAVCSLVYRKSLRLSQSSLGRTTIGQLVNLLSNDVNRFDQSTIFVHYLWVGPIQTAIVTVILWTYYGPACLAGLAVLVLFVPFQGYMGRLFSRLRTSTAMRTDRRIRLMNEIVAGMRVIKMYTWEKPFANLVNTARTEEIDMIRRVSRLRAVNMSLFYTSSKVVIFLTLLTYVLTGNSLTAEKVFVTLSLYNNVRLIMTLFFPNGVSQLAEALVSVKRIENFLFLEERKTTSVAAKIIPGLIIPSDTKKDQEGHNNKVTTTTTGMRSQMRVVAPEITLSKVSAKWTVEYDDNTLSDVTLQVKDGELLAVIGHVGSGKSSLLQAMLEELPPSSGTVKVTCSTPLAYASQEPWVFAGTVRANILFGKEYDASWYATVVEACALARDLQLFPNGDNTLVGDKGASLSGGQKARITLARAVYADADIYLLDDPLSAVDAEVGRHLFEKCICGLLSKKTRVLVTHQLQFLKNVDHIALLDSGRVVSEGSFDTLVASGIDFAQLLHGSDNSSQQDLRRSSSLRSATSLLRKRTTSNSSSRGSLTSAAPADLLLRRRSSLTVNTGDGSLTGNTYVFEEFNDLEEDDEEEQEQQEQFNNNETPLTPLEESVTTGNVKIGLYVDYFKSGGSLFVFVFMVVMNLATQVLFTGSDYFLNFWTQVEEDKSNDRLHPPVSNSSWLHPLYTDQDVQIYVYSGIILGLFVTSTLRTLVFFNVCMAASVNLHSLMFNGVLNAPMRFFETNPIGRILNRFSKDAGQMDDALPPTFFDTIGIFLNVLGILLVIGLVNPMLLAPAAVLSVVFYLLRRFYLRTARSIKRLEGVARSPVFSHLSTSLYGLPTIRAFEAESPFCTAFDDLQDMHTSTWYLFISSTRWFGIWLDWISVAFIAIVTFSFMVLSGDNDSSDSDNSGEGAKVGLAVSSAMMLTGMFQWGVRQSAEVENQMVSVERVLEYTHIQPEEQLDIKNKNKNKDSSAAAAALLSLQPPTGWPSRGEVVLNNVTLHYGADTTTPPVLNNVTVTFHAKEKVGIVGRTGAGKSSLITALFRIAEPSLGSSILIDGVETLTLPLETVRSKISIIPQDPVLFTGTLRSNLDPFGGNVSDDQMWEVLRDVHLDKDLTGDSSDNSNNGLDIIVTEGGSNFSVGQRQLVCLARAILRRNRVLVLDEATANVDPETDALIQKTIREKFADCTVLTVAHRLHTVMDADKILVLDAGQVKEYAEPSDLLDDRSSLLSSLVAQTGPVNAQLLRQIATDARRARILSKQT